MEHRVDTAAPPRDDVGMTNTETYEERVAREVATSAIADIMRGETDFRPATVGTMLDDVTEIPGEIPADWGSAGHVMVLIRLPDGHYVAVSDDDVTYVAALNAVVIDLP